MLCLLLAPTSPALPTRSAPRPSDDLQSSVDRINAALRQQWHAQGIQPAERAAAPLVARRLSLALAGTIPSVEELRQLDAQMTADGGDVVSAHSDLPAIHLQSLLADRRSSDYLAERLARAFVGVQDGPFLIYRRRRFVSWLADELQANRPYDQLVRRLIAEQGLWTDHPATNFITVTIRPDEEQGPDENALAARVSRAFLGTRLDCAECHDHPFREWKQTDFQSLAAFFGQTRQSFTGIRDGDGEFEVTQLDSAKTRVVQPAVPFAADLLPVSGERRERLAQWVTDPANNVFALATANRAWAMLFGRPLVEPVDDIPRNSDVPEVLQLLAEDFVSHGHDFRRLLTVIASCEAFQLDSRHPAADSTDSDAWQKIESAWAVFPMTRLRPEQVVGSLLQSASLCTIDHDSHILVRFARTIGQKDFVERYGDAGEEEFSPQAGAIPQRLLMMNGELVREKTKDSLLANAATQIAVLAPDDRTAIEVAYLSCLSRAPTAAERAHFEASLQADPEVSRRNRLGDLCWALINSTEFSWNH